jgi:hypothetical protein
LHAGRQNAISALWPACKLFLLASVQILHLGLQTFFAFWPACKFRLLAKMQFLHSGSLRAKIA